MRSRSYKEKDVPDYLRVHVRYNRCERWQTYCRLYDEDDNLVAWGAAFCSARDNPVRKIGRAIAVGRALKKYWEKIDAGIGGT